MDPRIPPMLVIWYNPFQPQGSWSDDNGDQEAVQESAVNPAQTNALVDPNQVEPQGADEEEDLAPMPDLEEYARILQRLAIEQEHDRINQLHRNPESEVPENLQTSRPVTLENEESCWIDDPLTSEDESDFQQSIMEASSIEVACNVIVQDDSASEAPYAEATDSQNASSSISSGATTSRVTSTEIASVGSGWTSWIANGEDQSLEPQGGLPKEEPPLEAFEVRKGTLSGQDYHKNYNQPSSSSYVNPSGKQAVNAPSGSDNENAGPKEAFNLISELERLNVDVDKHAPLVLQIEMDYRVKKSKPSSNGEKKEAGGPCTECLSIQNAANATITFNKEDLLLGETKHNRPLYFMGYIKEMTIHRVQIDPGSALNLISATALEELGIPPCKLSHTSVSIFGYDGSAQRSIGKIKFRLQIGDLISEVTMYAIKTPSCYNILLRRPWIHENGIVHSTLHQCIKFVGDDGLIHRVFADKNPFKGKEVHFADSQMYNDEKEEKEEKITSFAGNLQKDKGKAPQ
ncbi:hypothetical protein AAC387_Pa04g1371 [Persea americana]